MELAPIAVQKSVLQLDLSGYASAHLPYNGPQSLKVPCPDTWRLENGQQRERRLEAGDRILLVQVE